MKKTAIITGGSRGIGLEIAKQLGLDGFNIIIVDMREEKECEQNYSRLKESGISYLHLQGDISKNSTHLTVIEKAVSYFGGIHVLVNNAGVGPSVRADLLELTEENYDRVMGINAKGTLFFTQAIVNQMLKQPIIGRKRGSIVNISSISAEVSSVSRGEYCISKAAVSMITKLFADRLAKEGIFVNEIRPGVIMTDMTSSVKAKYDAMFENDVFPIPRWGTPEDVAGAVSAFCSDKFLYTTGEHIYVDGGFHIKRL